MNQLQTPFVRNLSLNIVTLAAGALLLLAMSVEILTGDHRHFSQAYLWYTVRRLHRLSRRLFHPAGAQRAPYAFFPPQPVLPAPVDPLPQSGRLVFAGARARLGMLSGLIRCFEVFWRSTSSSHGSPGTASINCWRPIFFSVLVFTYLASLVFYDYEILVNPRLTDYGDALWWAWMNVTTVGAAIFPARPWEGRLRAAAHRRHDLLPLFYVVLFYY